MKRQRVISVVIDSENVTLGEQILVMYNSTVYSTADVLSTYIYRIGMGKLDFSTATALGLFESAVGFILMVTCNKISRKALGRSLW